MTQTTGTLIEADVISVTPGKVKIQVNTNIIENWETAESNLKVGSYLTISDNAGIKLIAIIENFNISLKEKKQDDGTMIEEKVYIIEAMPLGTITGDHFVRGGNEITIPPKGATPSTPDEIMSIYNSGIEENSKFSFSKLTQNPDIQVYVDGNKFFNKHFSIVGSTGSGKSHTVAKILQNAIDSKNTGVDFNNSHIVLFDIHGEYKSAFSNPNYIDVKELVLPYWLLNSEELEEFFLDTEANDHNQRSIFKELVVKSRRDNYSGSTSDKEKIHYDSPLLFDINDILTSIDAKNTEVIDTGEVYASGDKKGQAKTVQGSLYGRLTNFVNRLENKISDKRLDFLLGSRSKTISFQDTLKQFLGYKDDNYNITILDLSGVPFDVLSITVSLISRLLFEYGYYYKKLQTDGVMNNPLLLVYEEAHKYVPKSGGSRYNAVRSSIERISKEGRKYGVTLGIVTQRPSEISETIFSQCSNFIAMRLTNPDDQNYVKRLLPDSLGGLIDSLSTLKCGEAILMGDSIVMPSLVMVDKCEPLKPSSDDIPYIEFWKNNWMNVDFDGLEVKFKE